FTGIVIVTNGIQKGEGNIVLTALVLGLIFVVNAGYGGGFSNVPTLLADNYGMGSISALHGITLSAWAFAGLSGNQMASWIVSHFGTPEAATNPVGYQTVLYVTGALYVVALLISIFLVRPVKKDAEA
ncbi:MAG: MFS transporter, partial [Firmicutes bacterium]|nr:MFS transporter [Bacillota bacterium]